MKMAEAWRKIKYKQLSGTIMSVDKTDFTNKKLYKYGNVVVESLKVV